MGSTGLDGQGFLEQLSVIKEVKTLKLNAANFGSSFYDSPERVFVFDGKVTIPANTRKRNDRMNIGTVEQFHQAFVYIKPGQFP